MENNPHQLFRKKLTPYSINLCTPNSCQCSNLEKEIFGCSCTESSLLGAQTPKTNRNSAEDRVTQIYHDLEYGAREQSELARQKSEAREALYKDSQT